MPTEKSGGYKNSGLQTLTSVEKIYIVTVVPVERHKTQHSFLNKKTATVVLVQDLHKMLQKRDHA